MPSMCIPSMCVHPRCVHPRFMYILDIHALNVPALDVHALDVHALDFAWGQLAARITLQSTDPIAGPAGAQGGGVRGRPGATQGHWGWWCRPRGSGRELPGRGQHCACATEVPSGPLRPLWCPEPWRSSLTAQQISALVACALPWYWGSRGVTVSPFAAP